ncbi:MAG: TraB/GumN family protein [Planctomycetes bacterium]|nr:TraB/GumN family protein [Planctomycetota bacterium]
MPLVLLVLLLSTLLSGVLGPVTRAARPQDATPAPVGARAAEAEAEAEVATEADVDALLPTEHPFLWRIEGDPPSWLYGTMHVGDPRLLALPDAVVSALDASDALYVEIPFDMGTMAKASAASFLPLGTSLGDLLPEATLARLKDFLDAHHLPFAAVQQLRPWALSVTLPMLVDPPSPEAGAPLDLTLWGMAGELGKDRGALETVEQQIGLFEHTSLEEQARMIESSLDQIEKAAAEGRSPNEALLRDYLAGDADALLNMADAESESDDTTEESARFERNLVVDRNMVMLDGILDLLDDHPGKSFFFAVGALHQVGPYGLAALLEAEGFDVTRIGAPEVVAAGP